MANDAWTTKARTGESADSCSRETLLVYAISGLGKSTLAAAFPGQVLDADTFLYGAVQRGFPDLSPRARLPAWRDLCQRRPWVDGGAELARWAAIRRAFVEPFVAAMQTGAHPLVVTSLLEPPWHVSRYYGVEKGRYLEHLRAAGRVSDNQQTEAMNNRLDGYSPLVRVPAGSFLGAQPEIRALLGVA